MKIGDVARRTGVAPRLVRYYEQQGLLVADRAANGYRTYSDVDVERVSRVAGMVRAGIPTRLIKVLLDLEVASASEAPACPRTVAEMLADELVGIEDKIACLTRSRDTIRDVLTRTEHAALLSEAAAGATPSAGR
ncbi:MerR family transcriptional regulator [Krasilnikoviella flava]|uniref:DNA-binding transcriptional regulator, MerR family n=1 Tax=Krasilnikoviella flava TaxID=526729 RepID=A0A1T5LS99_9MICO|nr:MerR family transcriptional regulator [Krasilnikoviella flava]SKC78771.1 DNA-binding transcriptional regulator, MerR family [Krasilnikoviella flava]